MDIIKNLYRDDSRPLMVLREKNRAICYLNETAKLALGETVVIGHSFDETITTYQDVQPSKPITFFNNRWFQLTERPFQHKNESYQLVLFEDISHIPSPDTLQSWKQMIAVMLHRFRSPLTGMSGYLEMMQEDDSSSESTSYIAAINKGMTHLFNMMDELEAFYNVPKNFEHEVSEKVNAQKIAEQVGLGFTPEIQDRISIRTTTSNSDFSCSSLSLKRILEVLIQNGIDHTPEKTPISVRISAPHRIDVTTTGTSIPEEIRDTLFKPFVTDTATNLGIGLPLALLYAQQFGGILFYSENTNEQLVTFSLCFP